MTIKEWRNSNISYLGFDDLWFMIIGILVLGSLIPLVFFGIQISEINESYLIDILEASLYSGSYWITNRYIMIFYRKRFPSFEASEKRILYATITVIVCLPITSAIIAPIIDKVYSICNFSSSNPTILAGFGAAFVSTFFIVAIYESIWYYSQLKKSIQEQERVKVAHVQSQLEGLRNQVNPHFLFNSLNTLNYMVENENKVKAKQFIGQLSNVYRYILESREDTTIILDEEIAFVQAYVAVQKERFLDNLNVSIDIPKSYLHKKIIPLSLQLLVENAIKHNIISTKRPLSILISIDENTHAVVTRNNLQRKSTILSSTKVGLENIKQRYALLTDSPVIIQEDVSTFYVILPLL